MLNILMISLALAMDSFSVAICAGTSLVKPGFKKPLLVGFYFGFFQALMAFLGWLGGAWTAEKIGEFDHWLAFSLLLFIGAKMLWSFFRGGENCSFSFSHANLFALAIATSIDAVGAGASLAFVGEKLFFSLISIGLVSFVLSFGGVRMGKILSRYIRNYAELLGGIMLIIIGIKLLCEHNAFAFFCIF